MLARFVQTKRRLEQSASIVGIVNKLRQADVELSKGQTVAGVCKLIAVTEQSYYRWRQDYGGLKVDQAKRFKELEQQNARLKRLLAELDKAILRKAAEPKLVSPALPASNLMDMQSMTELAAYARSISQMDEAQPSSAQA